MTRILFIKKLKYFRDLVQPRRRHGSRNAGFTLIELLVSIIIGAIITILLLSIVVELTQTNQQDAARTRVQQDMQAATDYIAQDLREAVFVYNGACLNGVAEPVSGSPPTTASCTNLLQYLPTELQAGAGRVPVLAFWRTDPLPKRIRDLCGANANSLSVATNPMVVARVPCIAGAAYSLVVYSLDSTPSNLWNGKARLVRYKLSKFVDSPADQDGQSVGYVNPTEDKDGAELSFQRWPLNKSGNDRRTDASEAVKPGIPTVADNPLQVLVDFVDDKGAISADADGNYIGLVTPTCSGFGVGDPSLDAQAIANALSPQSSNANTPYSFYVCVRGGGASPSTTTTGENQEVLLTLVGNVAGQPGFPNITTTTYDTNKLRERLSPIQTRVLVRGINNKQGV